MLEIYLKFVIIVSFIKRKAILCKNMPKSGLVVGIPRFDDHGNNLSQMTACDIIIISYKRNYKKVKRS